MVVSVVMLVSLFYLTMIVIARSLRRRRTDILYVGESNLEVGEQTVGETTGYHICVKFLQTVQIVHRYF